MAVQRRAAPGKPKALSPTKVGTGPERAVVKKTKAKTDERAGKDAGSVKGVESPVVVKGEKEIKAKENVKPNLAASSNRSSDGSAPATAMKQPIKGTSATKTSVKSKTTLKKSTTSTKMTAGPSARQGQVIGKGDTTGYGGGQTTRGTLLIRGLPLGNAEPQLREWLGQFGKVARVTVARSARTGNPKGYGFVEFAHRQVAKVVAEMIPTYLMFGRTLRLTYRDDVRDSLAKKIFKNSNRRWSRPNKQAQAHTFISRLVARRSLQQPKTKET